MHSTNRLAKKRLDSIVFYIVASTIGFLIIIPFFWMISTAIKTQTAIFTYPIEWIPSKVTFENFVTLFQRFPFVRVILNSVIISVFYTFISLVSCSMAAFAFAKIKFKGSGVLLKIFLITLMIPFQSTLIPLFMIFNSIGLSNSYTSVVLPSFFRVFGIFMLVQNMKTIPDDYIEAARIDGASYFKVFYKVLMPLSAPIIAAYSIITFMDSWNDYLWPLVMLTKTEMMTLPVALGMLNGQYERNFGVLMAGSLVSIIPIIIVYILAQRQFKSGISLGGIKG